MGAGPASLTSPLRRIRALFGSRQQSSATRAPDEDHGPATQRPSAPHPLARRVQHRLADEPRRAPFAEDLDREPHRGLRAAVNQVHRHEAQRDALPAVVRVPARGHEAGHLAAREDRLVAPGVRVVRVHHERAQPAAGGRVALA